MAARRASSSRCSIPATHSCGYFDGAIERIGLKDAVLRVKFLNQANGFSRLVTAPDHTAAVNVLMDWMAESGGHVALTAVGHRVVCGGPKYSEPQLLTSEMVEEFVGSVRSIPSTYQRRLC